MTTIRTLPTKPLRPRRIAADEAHAWARNLRLGNSLAKLVLSMMTGYVNGDGICYVGIEALSEDTELSTDTVRKRLAWLEQVGAIARLSQWIDSNGRRNGEGRGKRTSDEIRLLLNADPEDIEARAKGNGDGDDGGHPTGASPSQQLGPYLQAEPVSPLVAPEQPSDSGKGLDSFEPEHEKKEPPNPPSGGVRVDDQDLERDIQQITSIYPAPITNMPRLRIILAAMNRDERRKVLIGAKGYAAYITDLDRRGKKRAVKDADRWVSAGMWQGYVPAGEKIVAASLRLSVPLESDDGKAWATLHKLAHITPFETGGKYTLPRPMSEQAMALAKAPPENAWEFVPGEDVNRCAAWAELVARELSGKNRPPLSWERNPGGRRGFYAPWPWPPRKDGSIGTGPPPGELSQEDIRAFD